MNIYTIENEILKVDICSIGAELQSVFNKHTHLEYLWSGDANFWSKKSPVLFPIVGGLKNNEYEFEGKKYSLPRHGFTRDNVFEVVQTDNHTIQFVLNQNESTQLIYPFKFEFIVEYRLENDLLFCKYIVQNTDEKLMYFSVGAHPAFALPLTKDTQFEDWYLEFNTVENCGIYPLTKDGLVKATAEPQFNSSNTLPLTKELFYKDALVFKELKSNAITIKSNLSSNGLTMNFDGFKYFGIWSAKNADFVCLEPWLGIADSENTKGIFTQKEGILTLDKQEVFSAEWSIQLF